MNEEILEEVDIETTDTTFDGSVMVDSVEEVEESNNYSKDELVSALLQLIEEEKAKEQESDNALVTDLEEEPSPVLVQSADFVDYTEQLDIISYRLESLESSLAVPEPNSLDTSLKDYSLDNILLVCVIVLLFVNFGYQFIKDNLLHF